MGVSFDHRDPGTSEDVWRARHAWTGRPELDLRADAIVVLAAHPDDETLGAGGLLALAHASGIPLSVVVVTDGDASHPDSPHAPGGAARRAESVAALDALAPSARLTFLGIPDGGIREHADTVERALRGILPDPLGGRVLVATTWWGDGHADHEALGEIALRLAVPGREVVGYPIWLWHWGDPDAVEAAPWRALALPDAVVAAKERAVARHRSQLEPLSDAPGDEPIVHAGMRAHFARDVEVFVAAPDAASAAPGMDADYFEGLFARQADPWGFATRWYEERKRSVVLSALPRRRYGSALELGCASGELSRALAGRCDTVRAVDASETALHRARDAGDAGGRVRFERAELPREWPEGTYDLVVASELLYYLDAEARAGTIARMRESVAPDGAIVACHWRHGIAGAPASGDLVHRELGDLLDAVPLVRHVEDDFVLEVFAAGERLSVAAAEGIA